MLAWIPRADGVFLTDSPQNLVVQGSVANIPFVTGTCILLLHILVMIHDHDPKEMSRTKGLAFRSPMRTSRTLYPCKSKMSAMVNRESVVYRTEDEIHEYLSTIYLSFANSSAIDELLGLYPQDPAQGSPFGTGDAYNLTAPYKRLAAIQGDIVFQAPRRFLLEQRSGLQNTWSFCKVSTCFGDIVLSMYSS